MKSEFETWPATPVEASLKSTKILSPLDLTEVASFFYKTEQPGSAGHAAGSAGIAGSPSGQPAWGSMLPAMSAKRE
jgi:hypothetical protein